MINTKRKHHMNLDKVGPKKQAYLDRQASWSWFGVAGRTRWTLWDQGWIYYLKNIMVTRFSPIAYFALNSSSSLCFVLHILFRREDPHPAVRNQIWTKKIKIRKTSQLGYQSWIKVKGSIFDSMPSSLKLL